MTSIGAIRRLSVVVKGDVSDALRDLGLVDEKADSVKRSLRETDESVTQLESDAERLAPALAQVGADADRTALNLSTVDDESAAAAVGLQALADGAGDALGDVGELQSALDDGVATDSLETARHDINLISEAIRDLPDLRIDAASPEELIGDLDGAHDQAQEAAQALYAIEDSADGLVAAADSADQLRRSLDYTAVPTEAFDELSDSARGLFDDALADADSLADLEDHVDGLGGEFRSVARQIEEVDDSTGGLAGNAVAVAGSFDLLAEQFDDVGDEANELTWSMGGLKAAMVGLIPASLLGSFDDLGAHVGFLSGRLSTMLKVLPALGAGLAGIGSSLLGVGTSALAGAGALGTLGAAAAAAAGEARAAESALDDIETRAEGIEAIFADWRESAVAALAPLQNAETGALFTGALDESIDVLESWVSVTDAVSSDLISAVDRVAGVWNESVQADLFDELQTSIEQFLPLLTNTTVSLLRALPDALEIMRQTAGMSADEIFSLAGAIGQLLGPVARLGSAAMSVLSPALETLLMVAEGFLDVAVLLAPPLSAAGDALAWLIDTAEPAIWTLGALAGAAFTVSAAMKTWGIITSLPAVLSAFTTAASYLAPALYGFASSAVVAATGATTLSGALTALWGLLGPVGWAVLALAAGIAAYQSNFLGFKDAVDGFLGVLSPLVDWLWDVGEGLWAIGAAVGQLALDALIAPFEILWDILIGVANWFAELVGGPGSDAGSMFDAMASSVGALLQPLIELPSTLDDIAGSINAIDPKSGLVSGFAMLGSVVGDLLGGSFGLLIDYLEWVNEGGLLAPLLGDATVLGIAFDAAVFSVEALAAGVGLLVDAFGLAYDIGAAVVGLGLGALWDDLTDSATRLATGVGFAVGVLQGLYGVAAELVGLTLEPFVSAWDAAADGVDRVARGIQRLVDLIPDLPEAPGWLTDLPSFDDLPGMGGEKQRQRGHEAGQATAEGFSSGAQSGRGAVRDAAEALAGVVDAFLPSSDADIGPLSNLSAMGQALPETFAAGMTANESVLLDALSQLTATAAGLLPGVEELGPLPTPSAPTVTTQADVPRPPNPSRRTVDPDEVGRAVERHRGAASAEVTVVNNRLQTDAPEAKIRQVLREIGISPSDVEQIIADAFNNARAGPKPGNT